jgi:hypothetical protein
LNPRFTIRRVLSEPLINAGIAGAEYHIHAVPARLHLRGVGDLGSKTTCKQAGKLPVSGRFGE